MNELINKNIIEVKDLHKKFGNTVVYRGANLHIRHGEVITIIGGSGIGKSVMLKHFIGLLRPDSGCILFNGEDITHYTEKQFITVRKRIAMLFQGGALFDSLSVEENIAYPLMEHTKLDLKTIQTKDENVLDLVCLAPK